MHFEHLTPHSEQEQFTLLLAKVKNSPSGFIEYRLGFPKYRFLAYLLEQGYLLHGSSVEDVETLEPRQVNDASKKSGNQVAVYAVSDPILPLFYAIKDRKKLLGMTRSGYNIDENGVKTYRFQIDGKRSEKDPWKNGVIYVLPKEKFTQSVNDDGELTDEWVSPVLIAPVARLRVTPEDFPYLEEVKSDISTHNSY